MKLRKAVTDMAFKMMGRKGPVEVDDKGNPIKNNHKFFKDPKSKNVFFGVIIPIVILLLISFIVKEFLFTVNEMEQALVVRFGRVQRIIVLKDAEKVREELEKSGKFPNIEVVEGKGLMVKTPFIDNVEKYSSQLITYKTLPGEVTALDKKKIVLDNNAQWVISNPALFRITMQTVQNGNTRLDDLIFSAIREKIGKINGSKLVSDKKFVYEMLTEIKKEVNEIVKDYGMKLADVRIAKTEFPKQNYENIFNRMRTERQKMANRLRAEGEEQYKVITANSDKEAQIIKAEAYAKAETIRGEGDAEALEIYANAYSIDPEFYSFYKTLETYRKTIGSNTRLVIDKDSDFAKYLFNYKIFNKAN